MRNIGCIFPCAGIPIYKLIEDFYHTYKPLLYPLLYEGSRCMNIDLFQYISKSITDLSSIESQLFVYSFSAAMFDALKKCEKKFMLVTGYSMGMFSSLFASGSISFCDGLKMLYDLDCLVKEVCHQQSYTMIAVIGLTEVEINKYLEHVDKGVIEVINQNSLKSFIISGISTEVKLFYGWAKDRGVLTSILPVALPYHTTILLSIRDKWEQKLNNYVFNTPNLSILCSNTQKIITNKEGCRKIALTNIFTTFSWYKTIKKIEELGIEELIECGPSKTLSKLGSFIHTKHNYITINQLKLQRIPNRV